MTLVRSSLGVQCNHFTTGRVANFVDYDELSFIAVKQTEQIRASVMDGQRPDLNAIAGPGTPVLPIKNCISRCWDQSPENRPSFAGRYCLRFAGSHHLPSLMNNFVFVTYYSAITRASLTVCA